jgi:hypothetical protein
MKNWLKLKDQEDLVKRSIYQTAEGGFLLMTADSNYVSNLIEKSNWLINKRVVLEQLKFII